MSTITNLGDNIYMSKVFDLDVFAKINENININVILPNYEDEENNEKVIFLNDLKTELEKLFKVSLTFGILSETKITFQGVNSIEPSL